MGIKMAYFGILYNGSKVTPRLSFEVQKWIFAAAHRVFPHSLFDHRRTFFRRLQNEFCFSFPFPFFPFPPLSLSSQFPPFPLFPSFFYFPLSLLSLFLSFPLSLCVLIIPPSLSLPAIIRKPMGMGEGNKCPEGMMKRAREGLFEW